MSRLVLCLAFALGGIACRSDPAVCDEHRARIAALEAENAKLQDQIDALNTRLEVALRSFGTPTICVFPPPIDALVLEVDAVAHTIVIDKGRTTEVEVGYPFDVYHGSVYKALVRVVSVEEQSSVAVILSEKHPIEVGDSASTEL
jgi:cell shape-determining protein MreC